MCLWTNHKKDNETRLTNDLSRYLKDEIKILKKLLK